jgi:hypothetical protein
MAAPCRRCSFSRNRKPNPSPPDRAVARAAPALAVAPGASLSPKCSSGSVGFEVPQCGMAVQWRYNADSLNPAGARPCRACPPNVISPPSSPPTWSGHSISGNSELNSGKAESRHRCAGMVSISDVQADRIPRGGDAYHPVPANRIPPAVEGDAAGLFRFQKAGRLSGVGDPVRCGLRARLVACKAHLLNAALTRVICVLFESLSDYNASS